MPRVFKSNTKTAERQQTFIKIILEPFERTLATTFDQLFSEYINSQMNPAEHAEEVVPGKRRVSIL